MKEVSCIKVNGPVLKELMTLCRPMQMNQAGCTYKAKKGQMKVIQSQ